MTMMAMKTGALLDWSVHRQYCSIGKGSFSHEFFPIRAAANNTYPKAGKSVG